MLKFIKEKLFLFLDYYLENFSPKLVEVLKRGYDMNKFKRDTLAGMTVAVVSIPLAMALAIASGVTPAQDFIRRLLRAFLLHCWAVPSIKSADRRARLWSLFLM